MAYGKKCYCCGVNDPVSPERYYCKSCLLTLSSAFKHKSAGILDAPQHFNHCISCGEWEGRHILYTGRSGFFPCHSGDGIPVCDRCIGLELKLLL